MHFGSYNKKVYSLDIIKHDRKPYKDTIRWKAKYNTDLDWYLCLSDMRVSEKHIFLQYYNGTEYAFVDHDIIDPVLPLKNMQCYSSNDDWGGPEPSIKVYKFYRLMRSEFQIAKSNKRKKRENLLHKSKKFNGSPIEVNNKNKFFNFIATRGIYERI